MTTVAELRVGSAAQAWRAIGLDVVDDAMSIGDIVLRCSAPDSLPSVALVVAWTLRDALSATPSIDGLTTLHTGTAPPSSTATHVLGVTAFDHLVVMTSSLDRTCVAMEAATGAALKRVREAGSVRQGFHRLGSLIVEVVETADVSTDVASFWGFVLVVDDIHTAADRLGPELLAAPKPAVQPGRFIASFRPAAGLGAAVALMSP